VIGFIHSNNNFFDWDNNITIEKCQKIIVGWVGFLVNSESMLREHAGVLAVKPTDTYLGTWGWMSLIIAKV